MVTLTFDGRVMAAKAEIIKTINKYELPASVIMLICENIESETSKLLKFTEEDESDGNINQKTNDSDNTKS